MKNDSEATDVPSGFSRRQFLRLVGLGALGGIAAGCDVLPDSERPIEPQNALASPAAPEQTQSPDDTVQDARLQRFLAVSSALTGFSHANLQPDLARTYMQRIDNNDEIQASLDDLFAALPEDNPDDAVSLDAMQAAGVFDDEARNSLTQTITTYWYTGVVPAPEGDSSQVATFVDALAWTSLTFTKPRSICGSSGFWASDPRISRQ